MKVILFTAILLALTFSSAFGQNDKQQISIDTQRAEMKKMENWIGNWNGSGWIQQGKEKEYFTGAEKVQKKLGGVALLVEGKFTNDKEIVIHETIGVVSYNLQTKNYDFNTFLANGSNGAHELKTTGEGWQWSLQFPGGKMRYNTKLTADTWLEIGEISLDEGKTWRKFFEMTLKKVI